MDEWRALGEYLRGNDEARGPHGFQPGEDRTRRSGSPADAESVASRSVLTWPANSAALLGRIEGRVASKRQRSANPSTSISLPPASTRTRASGS
jgi:hypothetical protein